MLSILITLIIFAVVMTTTTFDPLSRWIVIPVLLIAIFIAVNLVIFSLLPVRTVTKTIKLPMSQVKIYTDSVVIFTKDAVTEVPKFYRFSEYDCSIMKFYSQENIASIEIPLYNKEIPKKIDWFIFNPIKESKFDWVQKRNRLRYCQESGKIRIKIPK